MLFKVAIRLVVSGLAMASLFANTAYAQNSQMVINAADITTYPPLAYKDLQSGEFKGFDRDLLEAMAKKLGATVKWDFFSFTDLASFAPLKTGRVDIYGGAGLADTAERRAQGINFIDYMYEPFGWYTLKSNADQFKSRDALCGKRVAVFRGSTGTKAGVDKWNDEVCLKAGKPALIQVEIDGGTPTAKLELKQGRVAAAIGGVGAVLGGNLTEGDMYMTVDADISTLTGIRFPSGMAFLKNDLGESLRKALEELIADGTYVELLKKWKFPVEESHIGKATINAGPALQALQESKKQP